MSNNRIGSAIWSQIPIGIKMACGAREARATENGLFFKVGRQGWIEVTLNGRDLYDVASFKTWGRAVDKSAAETASDIFAEDLAEVVYRMVNK